LFAISLRLFDLKYFFLAISLSLKPFFPNLLQPFRVKALFSLFHLNFFASKHLLRYLALNLRPSHFFAFLNTGGTLFCFALKKKTTATM
jgi:hypothetical protein